MEYLVGQDLIHSVKQRDHHAFKKLYEGCIRYVYTIVRRYVADASYHQDIIQEIFARVYLSIHSYDESKGEFKFWLRRITINKCIQHYRQYSKSLEYETLDSADKIPSNLQESPGTLSREEIMLYLNKMPEGYKHIFMMVIIDEYSHKDTSEILNISPETSRSQLHRAKKWLRENLSSNDLKLLASGV